MTEKRHQRRFTKEFKTEALELAKRSEKSMVDIAGDLGIHPELLYRWKSEYKSKKEHAFPGTGYLQDPEKDKLRRMERKLISVQEERDILKKAFGQSLESTQMKYEFIQAHRSVFAVKKMCQVLKVSRSGYYDWFDRSES